MEISEIIKIKELERYLLEGYGKKCKDYSKGCPVCDAWKIFDKVKGLVRFCDECEKDEIKI